MTGSELAAELRRVAPRAAEVVVDLPEETLRRRPAAGEWSAIEVVGHLVDKLERWKDRATSALEQECPSLESYDQDECVRQANYQTAAPDALLGRLVQAGERFARLVEPLTPGQLGRLADHGEYGKITLLQCVTLPLDSVGPHLRQAEDAATG